MSRILMIGASGMLGSSLAPYLKLAGHTVFRQSRSHGFDIRLNILSCSDWQDQLVGLEPDVVVNLAAATNVDRCETDPHWACQANVEPLLAFVSAAHLCGVKPHIVHISTDQVYDGPGLHFEDKVDPANFYGLTKLCAELSVKNYPSTILRTNFFGMSNSSSRVSFSDWIVQSLKAQKQINLFKDVLFSPVHISSLCNVIKMAIDLRPHGIYNVGSTEGVSKAQFGLQLANFLGLSTEGINLRPISEISPKGRRPLDMRMSTIKLDKCFGISSPRMDTEIQKAALEYHG